MTGVAPICPYCGQISKFFQSSKGIYFKDYGPVYACMPCSAWVGCHKGTETPLGRLANRKLRIAKMRAHAAFDPLWKKKMKNENIKNHEARGAAYKWLSEALGVASDDCHIGMFDVETCMKVVEVCAPYNKPKEAQ